MIRWFIHRAPHVRVRRTSTALLALACALIAVGCRSDRSGAASPEAGGAAQLVPQPPNLDLSTPDRAVQSYWVLNDSGAAVSTRYPQDTITSSYRAFAPWRARWRALFTGAAKAYHEDTTRFIQTFAREVVEVELQSPTHAVVTAVVRNTSPIPAGATPTEYDIKRRRDGDTIRYILERDSLNWHLSQAKSRAYEGAAWSSAWEKVPYVPTSTSP